MEKQIKTIGVLTSGGDAPGMNAAVRAVVRTGLHKGFRMIGIQRGYNGLLNGECFEMNLRSVSNIISAGGTILYTARCLEFKTKEGQDKGAEKCRELGIDALVVIGGDGSFTGAKLLSDEQGINVVGIPGTIDNDLAYTDYTLGFDTAVNTVLWAINALRDTMTSHDRVSLVKVMGRRCGDIALYAGICGGAEYILVPEVPYDIQKIANEIKHNRENGKTANVIVLAEGAGNENEIKTIVSVISGTDVKVTTLGHIQRGGSPSMADRMLAAKFGVHAVNLLMEGKTNRVIGCHGQQTIDLDISEALAMKKDIDRDLYDMAAKLC